MSVSPSIIGMLGSILLVSATLSSAQAVDTTDTCQATGWDMSRELATFHSAALNATAGSAIGNVPVLQLDHLYVLQLHPQSAVQFVRVPEKAARAPTPSAGLARFTATMSGKYRVTVDAPLWIDVLTTTGIIPSTAFNGWHQCSVSQELGIHVTSRSIGRAAIKRRCHVSRENHD